MFLHFIFLCSLLTERRPARAYSVGSRLEHNKRKLRVDLLPAEHNNARTRAFSVGSRAKMPRSELYRGVIQTAHLSNIAQEAAANATNNNNNTTKSSKSLSAPMLINNKNPGSIDPMDDLMEIDYTSKNTLDNSCSGTPIKISKPVSVPVAVPVAKRFDGLSDMLPGREKLAGYVEMKPVINAHEPFSIHSQYGYMEMKPVGSSSGPSSGYQASPSSSPKKSITSPKTIPTKTSSNLSRNNNYMDMTPRSMRLDHPPVAASPHGSSDDYLKMSPICRNSEDKSMEVDLPKTLSAPEGYMEMSWGTKSSASNSNAGTTVNNNLMDKPASDEYINMNFNRKDDQTKETRLSSLPIAIQLNKFNQNIHKNTMGNVPPSSMNLSALLKNSRPRCDSKDSGIVTPSGSHPSIFPFSPGSPNKQFSSQTPMDENNLPRKCLVDASTGTLRLSEDDTTAEHSNNSWSQQSSVDLSSKILNTDVYMDAPSTPVVQPVVDKLSNDYADMTIRSKKPKTPEQKTDIVSDYVNCSPLTAGLSKPITNKTNSIPSRDYEIMNPALTRKTPVAAPEPQVDPQPLPAATTPVSMKKFALITINSNPDKLLASASTKTNLVGFKPISSLDEQLMKCNTKDLSSSSSSSWRPRYTSAFSRQLSEKGSQDQQQQGESSPYELLQMRTESSIPFQGRVLSRPNSVNSEKIPSSSSAAGLTNLTRPNSANSDRLPTISTSSSSSTLCGSSSSSQTLCGSKCQSPLTTATTTRPQSFSEIEPRPESVGSHIASRPPSVSSERELHYASLDLPPPSSEKSTTKVENTDATMLSLATAAANAKAAASSTGDSSSSSPSPNAGTATDTQTDQPTFTYAQIDFIRSESMNVAQSAGSQSNSGMITPQPTATTTNQLHSPQK